ncbi:hypothetical protein [Candidatus Harpocratesius sp.]
MSDQINVYLKAIDYKRSIGKTQWSIFSLFATGAGAAFIYSFKEKERNPQLFIQITAVSIQWQVIIFYNLHRRINKGVAEYLVQFESSVQFIQDFQKIINKKYRTKRSSSQILIIT